ncbi:MAG: DsbA family protein [Acidobacteriota bacterium]|nr:DsbA family protein [Acidobacteriota bacterium]
MRSTLLALSFLAVAPLFAADVDSKLERAVRDTLPVCSGAKLTFDELPVKLPTGFTGKSARVEGSPVCEGQYAVVLSRANNVFIGAPWPLSNEEGKTIEQKLGGFVLRNMQENMTVNVDRTARTADGLFKATLLQSTEYGKLPLEGEVDPEGNIFFFGHFRPVSGDIRSIRTKTFEPFVAHAPAKGASSAKVTVLEFSDFQCPSCQRASGYMEPILAQHGDKVRYVRYDLPLSGHAWAFPAALAGRAIWRQKPDAFWDFKKQVYANQSSMNAFTFWDWARGFAEDHELDLKKYDADLNSQEIKDEILRGAGTAFANDVRATPSYMVNGVLVEAGEEGKGLVAYIDQLLAAK